MFPLLKGHQLKVRTYRIADYKHLRIIWRNLPLAPYFRHVDLKDAFN